MNNQHSSSTSTTTDSTPPLQSTSDSQKLPQSSSRSREAIQRRNKKRHQKMKIKQRQHTIKRKIHHQWTILQIKQYLDSCHIRYARVLPIHKNILKIQFNNQDNQDFADTQLGLDIFNENNYKEFISNKPS